MTNQLLLIDNIEAFVFDFDGVLTNNLVHINQSGEEIAFELGYITKQQLIQLAQPLTKNQYGKYLLYVAEGNTSS